MPPLRIAFGCQARVGKDTACDYLKTLYGGVVYHFSDPLYDILYYAQDVCGFPRAKDRRFLQWIGTEWARTQKETVWVDALLKRVPTNQNCYVGDARFPNEAQALQDAGFYCVRVVRDQRPTDSESGHSSELALADWEGWDAVLENNGTRQEFYEKIEVLVNKLKDRDTPLQDE